MLCGNEKKSLSLSSWSFRNAERWERGDPIVTAPLIHVTSPKKKSFKELHEVVVRAEKARVAEDDEEFPDQGVKHKIH